MTIARILAAKGGDVVTTQAASDIGLSRRGFGREEHWRGRGRR